MKKMIIILGIVFIIVAGLYLINNAKSENVTTNKVSQNSSQKSQGTIDAQQDNKNNQNEQVKQIKGISLVTDKEFQNRLIQFMKLDIEQNYKEIYSKYLSKGYLKKYYIDVKNADEYEKSKDESQLFAIEFLEITYFRILRSDKYQVDLTRKDGYEGDEIIKKVKYLFIKENNQWEIDDSGLIR